MRRALWIALVVVLACPARAQPSTVTLTFTGLASGPFHGYSQSNLTVVPSSGSWMAYGSSIIFWSAAGETTTAGIRITSGGRLFRFNSVALYSSTTPVPYVFVGSVRSRPVFTATATRSNTYGNYVAVDNPYSNVDIDTLEITLTNPAFPCCINPSGLDNIVVTMGSTPGDFTGDGKADILWRHATRGDVWLWPMDGTSRTAETPVRVVADTNWEIRGTADHTGDGTPDILWRNSVSGALCLWPMQGSALLSETYIGTVDPSYDIVATGDYNGDGMSDILWRHTQNGDVWMWLMDGPTRIAEVRVGTVNPAFVVKGSADLDGDGKADIVWCRHGSGAEVWVWLMDGPTRVAEAHVATVPDVLFDIVAVADYTGDGKADILWRHMGRGDVWLWPMKGAARTAELLVGSVADRGYRVVGDGDYNGDGKADILWHHSARGEVWVWLMDGARSLSQSWVATVADVGYQVVTAKRRTETFAFTLPSGSPNGVTLGPVQAGIGPFEVVLDYAGAYRILACVGTAMVCKVFGGAPMRAVFDIPGDFPGGLVQVTVYFNPNYTQPPGDATGTVRLTYSPW